jgi:4-diphosphocytidyl-2-C-methyl-D-erythritol kinase
MATYSSYAKINLHLQVVGRRADGYHELRTIFQTVDLADSLEVELGGAGVRLEVSGAELPGGPGNLAWEAADRFLALWAPGQGVGLRLHKRIPMGGGLGGGSSNAATVLAALQSLLGGPAPPPALWDLARQLGADVPYFLLGGTALGFGRGDELVPLPELPERELLLVLPPLHIATREVFADLGELTPEPLDPRIGFLVQCNRLDWGVLAYVSNDLERPVFRRWPELARLQRDLLAAGATTARLSGSGTALWSAWEERADEALQERLGGGHRLVPVRTLPRSRVWSRAPGGPATSGC